VSADSNAVLTLIDLALAEDIGSGDVTTEWTIPTDAVTSGKVIARQRGVISGLDVARKVFARVDGAITLDAAIRDGDTVNVDQVFATAQGPARGILSGERTALNFLRHLSGVATLTGRFVREIEGTGARIVDTRKTTPGFRTLEKAAVRHGGGSNHRTGLYDMILIKDNHIAATGGLTEAVTRCRERLQTHVHALKIEVEAATLDQVDEATRLPVDRIMLDNMSLETMRKAVDRIRAAGRPIEIEASGALNLDRVRSVAQTGVDIISIGALTHSAPALDISLDIA
jgi:nicotinate-nucleotide pyrophosphorylase (carboxylating)